MARILFIESDPYQIDAMREMLMREGYDVAVARSVAEGEHAIEEEKYDTVVLELSLPPGSSQIPQLAGAMSGGMYLLRKIQQTSPSTPIIIFTGFLPAEIIKLLSMYGLAEVPPIVRKGGPWAGLRDFIGLIKANVARKAEFYND
jgi:DNA-binding response OmpR family regulator